MELPTEGKLAPLTVRIYHEGVEIEPHQDILAVESPDDPEAQSLVAQFGANVYLTTSDYGGDLQLYDEQYTIENYNDLSLGPRVVSRDKIPAPSVTITPHAGDLILFPSRRLHAVSKVSGESPRVTVSFFVGASDSQAPLRIWA